MPCKPKQGNAFENRNSRARAHGFNSKLFLKALNVRAERRALWKTHGAAYCPPTLLPPCSRPVAFGDGLGRASCPPEATAEQSEPPAGGRFAYQHAVSWHRTGTTAHRSIAKAKAGLAEKRCGGSKDAVLKRSTRLVGRIGIKSVTVPCLRG